MPSGALSSWDDLIGQARGRARRRQGPQPEPAVVPCEIVLSMAKGSNGRVLNVRCRCMAGTVHVPSRRFVNYDLLGQASSLDEALWLWREHRERRDRDREALAGLRPQAARDRGQGALGEAQH